MNKIVKILKHNIDNYMEFANTCQNMHGLERLAIRIDVMYGLASDLFKENIIEENEYLDLLNQLNKVVGLCRVKMSAMM